VGIGAWYGFLALLVWETGPCDDAKAVAHEACSCSSDSLRTLALERFVRGAKGRLEMTFPSLYKGIAFSSSFLREDACWSMAGSGSLQASGLPIWSACFAKRHHEGGRHR
jgi:hypothetical protein